MNCSCVVATECCKNNCQTDEKHDGVEEYEGEKIDEEEIDKLNAVTKMG